MPTRMEGAEGAVKRKSKEIKHVPSKRARSESPRAAQSRILLLENQIFQSKKYYNHISTLLQLLQGENEQSDDSVLTAVALCRVFTRLLAAGDLVKHPGITEKDTIVILWLGERYSEFKTILLKQLSQNGLVGSTALTLSMRMLKSEGTHHRHGQEYCFPTKFLNELLRTLLASNIEDSLRSEFLEKYMEEYDDIRFYAFAAVESILNEDLAQNADDFVDRAIELLGAIEAIPERKEELEDFYIPPPQKKSHALYSLIAHKKHAQAAWLALMRMEMHKERRKRLLSFMTTSIAPWFIKPELLLDFLSHSYNSGGSTSLLALSGVFYLIREKNLDYPSFYLKLYSLLDRDLLHSKHRSGFFRLLDTFLASTHLPAVLVASFIKRLSRLTLNAPPAGIVAVIPWIYNLLKRHLTCTFMIHREVRGHVAGEYLEAKGMEDPFLADEEDPMSTNAIGSSLWEIVMLQSHYQPNVATLANIISEQFTKQAYNLEDFLDHSYGSMLEAELSKEVKKVPVVEYEIPKKIFMKQDIESGVENSLLVKLWDFS